MACSISSSLDGSISNRQMACVHSALTTYTKNVLMHHQMEAITRMRSNGNRTPQILIVIIIINKKKASVNTVVPNLLKPNLSKA
eukprot:2146626-Amphidinium_carterae.1